MKKILFLLMILVPALGVQAQKKKSTHTKTQTQSTKLLTYKNDLLSLSYPSSMKKNVYMNRTDFKAVELSKGNGIIRVTSGDGGSAEEHNAKTSRELVEMAFQTFKDQYAVVPGWQYDDVVIGKKDGASVDFKYYDKGVCKCCRISAVYMGVPNITTIMIYQKESDLSTLEAIQNSIKIDEGGVVAFGILNSKITVGYATVVGNKDETTDSEDPTSLDYAIKHGKASNVAVGFASVGDDDYSNSSIDDDKIFDVVEQMPTFPGGTKGLMTYLAKTIKYPSDAENKGIQGRVILRFVVERDGSVTNISVGKSVYSSLDKEAIRVVSVMPKWNPGTQNGQRVRVRYTMPVTFRLSDGPLEESSNSKIVGNLQMPSTSQTLGERILDVANSLDKACPLKVSDGFSITGAVMIGKTLMISSAASSEFIRVNNVSFYSTILKAMFVRVYPNDNLFFKKLDENGFICKIQVYSEIELYTTITITFDDVAKAYADLSDFKNGVYKNDEIGITFRMPKGWGPNKQRMIGENTLFEIENETSQFMLSYNDYGYPPGTDIWDDDIFELFQAMTKSTPNHNFISCKKTRYTIKSGAINVAEGKSESLGTCRNIYVAFIHSGKLFIISMTSPISNSFDYIDKLMRNIALGIEFSK